jgi:hypothetical protein
MPHSYWNLFLELLRAGLWEQDLSLDVTPKDTCWERLLEMSRVQAVTGLLLRGITHLPKDQLPPAAIRMKLLAEADEIERKNLQAGLVEREVLAFFEQRDLHPIVQKGSQAAKYYAEPLVRESGDVDLYFPGASFEQAVAQVPQARRTPDGGAVSTYKGVTVEFHPRYYDLHLPAEKLPPVPSVTGELLLYSAHILKHAIGAGVGLKQLCDMARALARTEGLYDKAELEAALRKAGLLRWHRLLCSMLVADLGLDEQYCLPDFKPCNPRPLRRIVRLSGNFGVAKASRRKSVRCENIIVKKGATALSFLQRIPFSIRIAPGEAFATFRELTRGNLKKR